MRARFKWKRSLWLDRGGVIRGIKSNIHSWQALGRDLVGYIKLQTARVGLSPSGHRLPGATNPVLRWVWVWYRTPVAIPRMTRPAEGWRRSAGKSLAVRNGTRPHSSGAITHEFAQSEPIRSFRAWRCRLAPRGAHGSYGTHNKETNNKRRLRWPAAPAHFATFRSTCRETFSPTRPKFRLSFQHFHGLLVPRSVYADYRRWKWTIEARFPEGEPR